MDSVSRRLRYYGEGAYILISTLFLFPLPFTVTFILTRASTIQCIQYCPPRQKNKNKNGDD